jgi:tripartite-type tricarboxylate transporter receptor subunit TctC
MKLLRRQFPRLAARAAALSVISMIAFALSGHGGWAQTARAIKIVVPLPPGGPADTLARLLVEQIGLAHGPTMWIENRPGASTVIGTEAVARAPPDGNTLLITAPAFLTTAHLRKLDYHPLTSFEPVCYLVNSPLLILVNSASPYRTLTDLINAARAKPGELTLAGTGPGSSTQIAFEMLKGAAKADIIFVPYPGDAPALTALLGGHVASAWVNYQVAAEHVRAGKLRALATPSRTRTDALPEVPTVAESGYQDVEVEFWNGLFAPAMTPKETVSQLAGWFTAALQAPELRAKLVARGFVPVGKCGADFTVLIRRQYDEFGRVIREANIKAE